MKLVLLFLQKDVLQNILSGVINENHLNIVNQRIQEGYTLCLDFEKAFDSIEWDFLLKTLEKFNSGVTLLIGQKIVYTDPLFKTKINGCLKHA